jgi:hypothetical protein
VAGELRGGPQEAALEASRSLFYGELLSQGESLSMFRLETEFYRLPFHLDTVRHFASAAHAAEGKPKTIQALIAELLMAIAKDPNPLRPGRNEPRAVKRRRKNYRRRLFPADLRIGVLGVASSIAVYR